MDADIQNRLMALPQVNHLLEQPELKALAASYSHALIKYFCQQVIAEKRQEILAGLESPEPICAIVQAVQRKMDDFLQPRLRRVINATGILIHTGLGRAPLLDEVYRRAFERVRGACNLELDLESGERGDRQNQLEDLLQFLTGCEASAVVNNNAAAVLIALNTLANRKETIVSRGQLIEIGGAFRLPEVMRKSGTRLVEVGTTNRTYLSDYEEAISPKTGAILLAHSSNYRIRGFAHEVDVKDLAALCGQRGIPLIHDLGGGVLLDLGSWNLPAEPIAAHSIAAGCSVTTFSGDKIIGGPQAGILVGETAIIRRIRKNPLMRALRPDKLTLALLEEALRLHLAPAELALHHPVLARLAEPAAAARARAEAILHWLAAEGIPDKARLDIVPTTAQLGSGALPLEEFPSAAVRIKISGRPASRLAAGLRHANPPVITYVRKDGVYVDVKAILDDEIELAAQAIWSALEAP